MHIEFHKKTKGSIPVLEFVERTPVKHRKKIFYKINRLKECGLQNSLQTNIAKKIQGKQYKGLYELIINFDNIFYRIFFITIGNVCWMLCAIKKKSNETPKNALAKAVGIKKQVENYYQIKNI